MDGIDIRREIVKIGSEAIIQKRNRAYIEIFSFLVDVIPIADVAKIVAGYGFGMADIVPVDIIEKIMDMEPAELCSEIKISLVNPDNEMPCILVETIRTNHSFYITWNGIMKLLVSGYSEVIVDTLEIYIVDSYADAGYIANSILDHLHSLAYP